MPATLYVHVTWTTRDRRPLIDVETADLLKRLLPRIAERRGATLLELGMVQDHVHGLLRLPPVLDIPRLMQGLKGASSRVVNRDLGRAGNGRLLWASDYDMRSVSPRALDVARRYVASQGERHPLDRVDQSRPDRPGSAVGCAPDGALATPDGCASRRDAPVDAEPGL